MDPNEHTDLDAAKAIVMRQILANQERKSMDFNEYQKQAQATDKYPDASYKVYINAIESVGGDPEIPLESIDHLALMMYTLGLIGESGEVADKIKKIFRDQQGQFDAENTLSIMKEIGDVMWYCASLSNALGWKLEDVAKMNIDKLRVRAENNKIHGSGDNR